MLAWSIASVISEERDEVSVKQIETRKHLFDWKKRERERERVWKRKSWEWSKYDVRQHSCLCFSLSKSAAHHHITWLNLILKPLILQAPKKTPKCLVPFHNISKQISLCTELCLYTVFLWGFVVFLTFPLSKITQGCSVFESTAD